MAILGSGKSLGLGLFSRCFNKTRNDDYGWAWEDEKVIIAVRHGSFVVGVLSYTVVAALLLFLFLFVPLGSGERWRKRGCLFLAFSFGGKIYLCFSLGGIIYRDI